VMVHIAMTCMIRILHGLSSDPSSAESKSIGITTIYRFGAALQVRRHGGSIPEAFLPRGE
jgi:hypothetical protein